MDQYILDHSSTLNVCFLNGNTKQHKFIEKCARKWSRQMNLAFRFYCTEEESHIAIDIDPSGNGSVWSKLGNHSCLTTPPGATMKLALGADLMDPLTEHLVLHEFGKLQ